MTNPGNYTKARRVTRNTGLSPSHGAPALAASGRSFEMQIAGLLASVVLRGTIARAGLDVFEQ